MPESVATAPAEVVPPVAPIGADSPPSTEVVPDSVNDMMKRLFADPDPSNGPKANRPSSDKPAGDAKPEPNPKVEAPNGKPVAGAPPPEPDIRVRKPKAPARPELPIAAPAAVAPIVRDEPYKADPQWESTLEENEREMLTDARFMEERFPDKYKGWTARTAKFLREHAALATKEEFDDQSPVYKTWLEKNQPRLSREQIREIEHARVTDSVRKEFEPKLAELKHTQFVRDTEPKIEQEGRATFNEMSNNALPDDVVAAIRKDGFSKANEQFGLEIETAQAVLTAATDDIVEFKRITTRDPETGRPLQAPVDDPAHPKYAQHQRLSQMVGAISEEFKTKAPAEKQLRDGKWFVTRDEWNQIQPAQRHRFWTFTNAELIQAAKANMKAVVAQAIEQKRGYITKLGFTRSAPKVEPPKPPARGEPPVPTNTPRIAAGTPVPGANDVMSDIDARADRMAKALGRDNLL